MLTRTFRFSVGRKLVLALTPAWVPDPAGRGRRPWPPWTEGPHPRVFRTPGGGRHGLRACEVNPCGLL